MLTGTFSINLRYILDNENQLFVHLFANYSLIRKSYLLTVNIFSVLHECNFVIIFAAVTLDM